MQQNVKCMETNKIFNSMRVCQQRIDDCCSVSWTVFGTFNEHPSNFARRGKMTINWKQTKHLYMCVCSSNNAHGYWCVNLRLNRKISLRTLWFVSGLKRRLLNMIGRYSSAWFHYNFGTAGSSIGTRSILFICIDLRWSCHGHHCHSSFFQIIFSQNTLSVSFVEG